MLTIKVEYSIKLDGTVTKLETPIEVSYKKDDHYYTYSKYNELIILENSGVVIKGKNSNRILGVDIEEIKDYSIIEEFKDIKFKSFYSESDRSFLISDEDELYVSGENVDGELGVHAIGRALVKSFEKVPDIKVDKVFYHHIDTATYLLSTDGKCYVAGNTYDLECEPDSDGFLDYTFYEKFVHLPSPTKLTTFALSWFKDNTRVMAIDEFGELYSYGQTFNGGISKVFTKEEFFNKEITGELECIFTRQHGDFAYTKSGKLYGRGRVEPQKDENRFRCTDKSFYNDWTEINLIDHLKGKYHGN
ncbi:MAG: hypothetical protein ACRC5M_06855 [Anaeroplasmataceae bacterium]